MRKNIAQLDRDRHSEKFKGSEVIRFTSFLTFERRNYPDP
ncbi:hypothetical protein M595_4727 [Lyngbya aestuarii BL J]|uniref:Uncharacterized protein n=1 Tax=Lyngbya aestuarii BL J TaxID=1348334 RepID=U7QE32_9CYAN|nr:hypothetical protein M595_4727 [Lyngbya aestuarii BL J]